MLILVTQVEKQNSEHTNSWSPHSEFGYLTDNHTETEIGLK